MFLATKLFLPPVPAGIVHRDRLYLALDESWAAGERLLLLSAPPGYGKTTLLSAWVQQRGISCAWVSLDSADSDPARFFLLLLHALKPFLSVLEGLEQVLKLPQPADFERLLAEMLNAAATLDHPVLLALDDYHGITSPPVHDLVHFMVDHLPPHLRVAVLTREDPPLALPRLRARRQMLELRAGELTFSSGEGHSLLLDALRLALDAGQVEQVMERTEGWAAGLQLAALSLRGHPDPGRLIESFGGPHRFVLDYLFSEVLDRLPPDLRRFLCRSAVLDRFSAGLCDAALETTGSREMIARAEAANLFLVPLDEARGWFRYHHLMAEILKAEIPPAECLAIQHRAASWWQANGQPVEAVHYALESRDFTLAAELIQSAALPAAENGLLTTVLGWLEALPDGTLLAYPELCVYRAWFLLFAGRFPEASAWLRQLSSRSDLSRPAASLLAVMQGWMVSTAGQPMDLARLREAYAMTGGQYPYFAPMALLAIGQAQREAGDLKGARSSFEEGARLAEVSSGPVSALILWNNLAFLLDEMGERQSAIQLCRENIEQHSASDGSPGLLAGIPMLPLGCFLYRSGCLEEAQATLTLGINLVRRMGLYHILAAPANYALHYVLADQGRLEEALALNRDVSRRAAKAGLQVIVRGSDWLSSWLQLLSGNLEPAARWADENPLPAEPQVTTQHQSAIFMHARLLIAAGQHQRARDLLMPVLVYNREMGLRPAWVRASVELALVHHAAENDSEALEVLAPAVECAVKMDDIQVFRQAAGILGPLYARLRGKFPGFIDLVCPPAGQPLPDPRLQGRGLVEPLGERELEILRLVAAGLSNAQIAERLYLTVGTVKWYLNQMFGKLGASRRTEAVGRARELGLI